MQVRTMVGLWRDCLVVSGTRAEANLLCALVYAGAKAVVAPSRVLPPHPTAPQVPPNAKLNPKPKVDRYVVSRKNTVKNTAK